MNKRNQCKICNSTSNQFFEALMLDKYKVKYYQCESCFFIQTETPYWLNEAYNSPITKLDIGLVYRNIQNADFIEKFLLKNIVNSNGFYLDYGGGYGMFVRMMRDRGFNFYRQDQFCTNLFAEYFDLIDLPSGQKFDVMTAFEVFEHLENPLEELQKMLKHSNTIIFSTELQPKGLLNPDNWWYFAPSMGQHISFYSLESLNHIACKLNLHLYSNKSTMHVFSKQPLSLDPFLQKKENKIKRFLDLFHQKSSFKNKGSLLIRDYEYLKEKFVTQSKK